MVIRMLLRIFPQLPYAFKKVISEVIFLSIIDQDECHSECYQQLSFTYFVKSFLYPKKLSEVS